MCVDPEGPQSIVQIESDQFGKWEAVGEGRGGHGGILKRLCILAFGADHDAYIGCGKCSGEVYTEFRYRLNVNVTLNEAQE